MRFERGTIFYYRNKVGYSTYNNKKIAPCFRPYINQKIKPHNEWIWICRKI